MVRHGLLSPNSKLLPGAASRAGTPMDGRPGSMLSVVSNGTHSFFLSLQSYANFFISYLASVMTKSGVAKDERDTPMRRVRHRDGKLLRGGIGLTTGLGWSDRWVGFFFSRWCSILWASLDRRIFTPTFRENVLCIVLCAIDLFLELDTDGFTLELLFG